MLSNLGIALVGLFPAIIAYLLPSQFLFDEPLRQRQKLRSLEVHYETTLFDEELPQGETRVRDTLLIEIVDGVAKLRFETAYPTRLDSAASTTWLRGALQWEQGAGQLWSPAQAMQPLTKLPASDAWLWFLIAGDATALQQRWQELGVDTQVRRFDKLANKAYYRIGTDESGNYIWLDPLAINPVAFSLRKGEILVRWDETTPYQDIIYLPQQMEIFWRDRLVERRRMISTPRLNAPLAAERFRPIAAALPQIDTTVVALIERLRLRYR